MRMPNYPKIEIVNPEPNVWIVTINGRETAHCFVTDALAEKCCRQIERGFKPLYPGPFMVRETAWSVPSAERKSWDATLAPMNFAVRSRARRTSR
jgi:hypothetical protein